MEYDQDWIISQLKALRQDLKNTQNEYGFVLKALEEELKEKGVVTTADLQKRVLHLNAIGWSPLPDQTER